MQGRLSPPVDGKIQAFPWTHWRDEFALAERHEFALLEWTLDHERMDENPLMTVVGRQEIDALSRRHGVDVGSLTGDCFMQAPFYKARGNRRRALIEELKAILDAAAALNIRFVLIPLVDNGRLEDEVQRDSLIAGLEEVAGMLGAGGPTIVFESDFPPPRLADLMDKIRAPSFGINYDIGNSAALGHDPVEEIAAYGRRIVNVHVKDRVAGGTTVPLGAGSADLPHVFRLLAGIGYLGDYILQTARAADGDDVAAACRYRDLTKRWIEAA